MASETEKACLGSSPWSPHPVQDDSRPNAPTKLLHTTQELLSLQSGTDGNLVITANAAVQDSSKPDPATKDHSSEQELLHMQADIDNQTAVTASALAQEDLILGPHEKLLRYTRQELLSLQPHAGDDLAVMANATVDECLTLDSVTQINSIEQELPSMQSDTDKTTAIMTDATSGWGGVEIKEEKPNQNNPITEAEVKDNDDENDIAEEAVEKKKKKKKKKSSGKNKKPPPTGFEGAILSPAFYVQMLTSLNRILRRSTSYPRRV
jgi:hypothetical protein